MVVTDIPGTIRERCSDCCIIEALKWQEVIECPDRLQASILQPNRLAGRRIVDGLELMANA